MPTYQSIMQLARNLVVAAAKPNDPEAYDAAYDALAFEVRQALGESASDTTEPTDVYAGLPIKAALEGGPFFKFDVPDDPVHIHPDMMRMMDDMGGFAAGTR